MSGSTPVTPNSSTYLQEVRKHVGMMVPGPVQAAAIVALDDDEHVDVQRDRYLSRLERLATVLSPTGRGIESRCPTVGSTCGFRVGDGWEFTERLAREGGALVSPGDFYGAAGADSCGSPWYNQTNAVQLVADRLAAT